MLGHEKSRSLFKLHAYCLMTNHFHLLIQVQECPLSTVMQRVQTRYARHFNKTRGRQGHVFERRYQSFLCRTDARVLEVAEYIHMNPVQAGLVSGPDDWHWSSYPAYKDPGSQPLVDTTLVLSLRGDDPAQAPRAPAPTSLEKLHAEEASPLESQATRPSLEWSGHHQPDTAPFHALIQKIAKCSGIEPAVLRGQTKTHCVSAVRKDLIRQALAMGFGPAEIGRFLQRSPSTICRLADRS